jgi:hypothetical protein
MRAAIGLAMSQLARQILDNQAESVWSHVTDRNRFVAGRLETLACRLADSTRDVQRSSAGGER